MSDKAQVSVEKVMAFLDTLEQTPEINAIRRDYQIMVDPETKEADAHAAVLRVKSFTEALSLFISTNSKKN